MTRRPLAGGGLRAKIITVELGNDQWLYIQPYGDDAILIAQASAPPDDVTNEGFEWAAPLACPGDTVVVQRGSEAKEGGSK